MFYVMTMLQKTFSLQPGLPKLGVPSCLETRLHLRVHLEEEKRNQEGKEMGIDYETAVQTVRSSKATAAEPRASSPYQSVSLVNSAYRDTYSLSFVYIIL